MLSWEKGCANGMIRPTPLVMIIARRHGGQLAPNRNRLSGGSAIWPHRTLVFKNFGSGLAQDPDTQGSVCAKRN